MYLFTIYILSVELEKKKKMEFALAQASSARSVRMVGGMNMFSKHTISKSQWQLELHSKKTDHLLIAVMLPSFSASIHSHNFLFSFHP